MDPGLEQDATDVAKGRRESAEWAERSIDRVAALFSEHPERVFFSRQIEVLLEDQFFHWVTHRAVRRLVESGDILTEARTLASGSEIHLYWARPYRYYRRAAARVVDLVNEYSRPLVSQAVGERGELLVQDAFVGRQFVQRGREARSFEGREWTATDHDLDFIFERDGLAYGVEVKNKLGYMAQEELRTKVAMCEALGLRPLFACRMLPKAWIYGSVTKADGYAMILKYQLYPPVLEELAKEMREELGLPVDYPRRLLAGTMDRFERWHLGQL